MTSIPQPPGYNMDLPVADDQMELGTSPLRQADDDHFDDLDPMYDRSVDNSMLDDADLTTRDADIMQADLEPVYEDDEMLDEAQNDIPEEVLRGDFDMGEQPDEVDADLDDEEILYDEDEGDPAALTNVLGISTKSSTEDSTGQKSSDKELGPNKAQDVGITEQPPGGANAAVAETAHDVETAAQELIETEQHLQSTDLVNVDENTKLMETSDATHDGDTVDQKHSLDKDETSAQIESLSRPEHVDLLEDVTTTSASNYEQNTEHALEDSRTVDPEQSGVTDEHIDPETERSTLVASADLHSIKLVYMDEEMSLFPPSKGDLSTTFFLQDATLANAALDHLLFSCREVLGDSLGHEDELVLDIPMLGLHICEDSKYSSSLTLSQVFEVYRALCLNEHLDPIEPLYCHLTSRVCLSTQYAYLSSAANEGKHFSEVAADYVDTPEETGDSYDLTAEQTNNVNLSTIIKEPDQRDHASKVETKEVEDEQYEDEVSETAVGDQSNVDDAALEDREFQPLTNASILASVDVEDQNDQGDVSNETSTEQENLFTNADAIPEGDLGPEISYDETAQEDYAATDDDQQAKVHGDNVHTHPDQSEQAIEPGQVVDMGQSDKVLMDEHEQSSLPANDTTEYIEFVENTTETGHNVDQLDTGEGDLTEKDVLELQPTSVMGSPSKQTIESDIVNGQDLEHLGEDGVDPDVVHHNEDSTEVEAGHQEPSNANELKQTGDNAAEVPVTPSKQSTSKRKAPEDEGDLDFLDFSTPEPKRTRPS